MLKKLCNFLDSNKIKYKKISHSKTETAEQTAQSAHINEREFAKTVMFKVQGKMAMAVISASETIDLELLATACDVDRVDLASEEDFSKLFPECETGAMPPVGNLYNMDVYIEEEMTLNDNITFNAGSHTELIQMSMSDYLALVSPDVVRLSSAYNE